MGLWILLSIGTAIPPSVRTLSPEARRDVATILDHTQTADARRRALERLEEPGAAYALCDALGAEDGAPKRAIQRTLARLEAARLFRADLDSLDPEIRAMAARMAACASDAETVSALMSALADEAPALRAEAADALSKLGAKESARALTRLLRDDPDPNVRGAAAQALGTLRVGCEALAEARKSEPDAFTRILIEQAMGRCR